MRGAAPGPRGADPPAPGAPQAKQRRRIRVSGVVQGVGFRPFVHGLGTRLGLAGSVRNAGGAVLIEAEGPPAALERFESDLLREAPASSRVESVRSEAGPATGAKRRFVIEPSTGGPTEAPIPPDSTTCAQCLAELFDPADRRYRYPFTNCAQCGPRLTIVRRVPYDRPNTTMAGFAMCDACRREYEDPEDRRFHAEPIACPDCGPSLSMPLEEVVGLLGEGAIVAVKGLGGYHLACDARSDQAVERLRRRKQRKRRPLAVMTAEPEELVTLTDAEQALLRSPARPIVLAERREGAIAPSVAPATAWLGVMLPYTPLHHLLARDFDGPLVMTSGNRSDEPIAIADDDARQRLSGIADAFCSHDRPIQRRCEDSVVRASSPLRRSRGYAPSALPLPVAAEPSVLAVGAELKSTFCLARGRRAFLSPHLGDLVTGLAHSAFETDLALYLEMTGARPGLIAHDLHPDYLSTRWALAHGAECVGVQHHHAHAAACLAEHGESGPALGVVMDGTGYGQDGTIWGGELLRFDLRGFERLAHLDPVPMPGGEAAVREPWRMAASYLERAGRPVPLRRWPRWPLVRESLRVNAPRSSSAGRLFDAVGALLGTGDVISFEAETAVGLEHLARGAEAPPYRCRVDRELIGGSELLAAAHDDLEAGRPRAEIAAAFHEGLAEAMASACEQAASPRTVVLSGGAFANLRLSESLARRLGERGFRVLRHRLVPPNDGGVSYGQAAIASGMSACA